MLSSEDSLLSSKGSLPAAAPLLRSHRSLNAHTRSADMVWPLSVRVETTSTTGPYYQGPARPTGWHRARKKGADWLERAQLTCVSLLAVARRFACCASPTSTRSLETKLRTDRVALATFAAGTYRESESAPPNNENSTVPPHHRNTTHSLNKPTHTGCVGPAAAKYCLLITSCGPPPTATRRAPPRATRY